MRRIECERRLDGRAPVVDRLPDGAVDQVEVERRHPGSARSPRRRASTFALVVGAAERGEHVGRHRLHTQADPVDAGVSIGREHLDGDVVGIALDGDLGVGGRPGSHAITAARASAGNERRRPTADEDRVDAGGIAVGDRTVDLGAQRLRGTRRSDGHDRSTWRTRSSRTSTRRTECGRTPRRGCTTIPPVNRAATSSATRCASSGRGQAAGRTAGRAPRGARRPGRPARRASPRSSGCRRRGR